MWIRPFLIVLLSLVLAFGLVCVAVLKTLDWKKHYGLFIAQQVAEATGRKMIIKGALDVRLSLRPAFIMHDVALANAPWGSRQNMMTAKECEIQIALLPLLGGCIQVRRLTLIEPDMIVEITRDRQNNLVFDAPTARDSDGPSGSGRPITLPALTVTAVTIRQATVMVRDSSMHAKQQHEEPAVHTLHLNYLTAATSGLYEQNVLSFEGRLGKMPIRGQGKVGAVADLMANRPFAIDLAIATADVSFSMTGVITRPLDGTDLDLSIQTYGTHGSDQTGPHDDDGIPRMNVHQFFQS